MHRNAPLPDNFGRHGLRLRDRLRGGRATCGNRVRLPTRAMHWLTLMLGSGLLAAQPHALPLDRIELPPGMRIELLARVPNARQMAMGPAAQGGGHVLYVGSKVDGRVHALELDAQGRPGALHVIAQGLRMPVGVAWRDGDLYISAVERIVRLERIATRLHDPPAPVVVRSDLPREASHGWRFIAFGPDGWLYVPVGAPCNICAPDPERYAAILRMRADGSDLQTYARGVRNSVGFDWHPGTGELWFTDNGRDYLGDDAPPDELNRAPRAGLHFGYPYCHGGTVPDPRYGGERSCSEFTPPTQALGAHVAALGMRFYTGTSLGPQWHGRVFIAEHGSWNRSRSVGYRVSTVRLDGSRAVPYEPFASGWLHEGQAWGRPADVLVAPDGALLVSDDLAGAIYRIRAADGRRRR